MTVLLSPFERRWAHATLDTLFPGPDRGALPAGILDMDVDGFLDETFRTVPFEAAIGLRLAFVVIALAPLFVLGKLATIASLRPRRSRARHRRDRGEPGVRRAVDSHHAEGDRRALLLRRRARSPEHRRRARPPSSLRLRRRAFAPSRPRPPPPPSSRSRA